MRLKKGRNLKEERLSERDEEDRDRKIESRERERERI